MPRKALVVVATIVLLSGVAFFVVRSTIRSMYESSDFRGQIEYILVSSFRTIGARIETEVAPIRSDGLGFVISRVTITPPGEPQHAIVATEINVDPALFDLVFGSKFWVRIVGKVGNSGSFAINAELKSDLSRILDGGDPEVVSATASAKAVDLAAASRLVFRGAGSPEATLKTGLLDLDLKQSGKQATLSLAVSNVAWQIALGKTKRDIKTKMNPATVRIDSESAVLREPLVFNFPKGKVTIEGGIIALAKQPAFKLSVRAPNLILANLIGRILGCRAIIKRAELRVSGSFSSPNCS